LWCCGAENSPKTVQPVQKLVPITFVASHRRDVYYESTPKQVRLRSFPSLLKPFQYGISQFAADLHSDFVAPVENL
jgi:hypothetical protein